VLHQDFELDIPDRGSKQYPGYDWVCFSEGICVYSWTRQAIQEKL
jgi:hypothetical protein